MTIADGEEPAEPDGLLILASRTLPARRATVVPVGPLTRAECDELLGRPAGELYERSGGNPRYLLELARHPEGVPPAIAADIAAELSAFSPAARELAQALAVDDRLGVAGPEALDALDELAGLVHETHPRQYAFRRPIVRDAVYASAGPGRRLALHAGAAATLTDPAERAHHLERCARPGDEDAIDVLVEAARTAAPDDAARWLAAAQRLGGDPALALPLAHALAATGRLGPALATLQDAPPDRRAVVAAATYEHLLGRHASATARLRALPEHDVALLVQALHAPDYVALRTRAKRAVHIDFDNAAAWALLATAHAAHGELSTAEEALDEAVALADPDAAYYVGFAAYMCERDEQAITAFRAARGPFATPGLVGLAHALERQGRLGEARRAAEQAAEDENPQMRSWALAELAYIRAVMGESSTDAAEEAVALAAGLDRSFFTIAAHGLSAATFLLLGEPARCLEQARLAEGLDHGRRAQLLVVQAAASGSSAPFEEALALVARSPLQVPRGIVGNALARVTGDVTHAAVDSPFPLIRAEAHLIRGLALADEADLRAAQAVPGAARLHDEAARALRALGHAAPGRQRRYARGELSGRERDIAELVADGLTNRQIASRLFLSEKTVEGHLSRVFGKLGVRSRAAAVARLYASAGST